MNTLLSDMFLFVHIFILFICDIALFTCSISLLTSNIICLEHTNLISAPLTMISHCSLLGNDSHGDIESSDKVLEEVDKLTEESQSIELQASKFIAKNKNE